MNNEIVQIGFNYNVLTTEQAQRTQEAEIRIIGRTQKTIIENGRDLLAVKKDIGHGHFLNWIQALGISRPTAERWMNVAENLGEIAPGELFENHAQYLLSTSKVPESAREEAKQLAAAGVTITEDLASQIRDVHKAKELAEQQAKEAQQQLDFFKEQTEKEKRQEAERIRKEIDLKNRELELLKGQKQLRDQEYKKLEQEKEQIALSKVQVIQEDTPETKAKLEEIEKQKQKLEELQKKLQDREKKREEQLKIASNRVEELSNEIKSYNRENQLIAHHKEIRFKWQQSCDAFHLGIKQGMARMVTQHDAQQAFEGDDWARLADLEAALQRTLEDLSSLRKHTTIDAMDYVTVVEA